MTTVYSTDQLRNVVFLGHGSSGKTSLAEAMLFNTGAINRIGKVEEGTTVSDFDEEEIRRRISLNLALIPCEWEQHKINVLDTPGYLDFLGEVISAIRVADAGIVLVDADTCGCEGSPCVESCPFGVMSVNRGRKSYFEGQDNMEGMASHEAHKDGVAEKCTLCHHRLKEGEVPFCVQACTTKALIFGDLDDQASNVSRLTRSGSALALKADLRLDVSVFYKKTR